MQSGILSPRQTTIVCYWVTNAFPQNRVRKRHKKEWGLPSHGTPNWKSMERGCSTPLMWVDSLSSNIQQQMSFELAAGERFSTLSSRWVLISPWDTRTKPSAADEYSGFCPKFSPVGASVCQEFESSFNHVRDGGVMTRIHLLMWDVIRAPAERKESRDPTESKVWIHNCAGNQGRWEWRWCLVFLVCSLNGSRSGGLLSS